MTTPSAAPSGSPSREHVERAVAAASGHRLPLPADARLVEDLGLTSLAVVELFVRLEDELHTEMDEGMVAAGLVATIADVIEALRPRVDSSGL